MITLNLYFLARYYAPCCGGNNSDLWRSTLEYNNSDAKIKPTPLDVGLETVNYHHKKSIKVYSPSYTASFFRSNLSQRIMEWYYVPWGGIEAGGGGERETCSSYFCPQHGLTNTWGWVGSPAFVPAQQSPKLRREKLRIQTKCHHHLCEVICVAI